MRHRALLIVGVLLATCSGVARAADLPASTGMTLGKQLATTLCSRCHAVGPTGESPVRQATPFRLFASKWPVDYLEESLAEGIVTGHDKMPEFVFTPDQIIALLGYINALTPE